MDIYGLLGRDIAYSLSPKIHERLWSERGARDSTYRIFDRADLVGFVEEVRRCQECMGFNVTTPYKEDILPLLDTLSPTAQAVGAVNTVKCVRSPGSENIRLEGFNTDVEGFSVYMEGRVGGKALLLGSGGAAKAVKFAFERASVKVTVVSRNREKGDKIYEELDAKEVESYDWLVNCTPLGSLKVPGVIPPIPYEGIGEHQTLIDLTYNPAETPFLKEGRKRGATTLNGLAMLEAQAIAAQGIWRK